MIFSLLTNSRLQRVLPLLLLAAITCSTVATSGVVWQEVNSSVAMSSVAVGPGGMWGIGKDGSVYYRTNTHNDMWASFAGDDWEVVEGGNCS